MYLWRGGRSLGVSKFLMEGERDASCSVGCCRLNGHVGRPIRRTGWCGEQLARGHRENGGIDGGDDDVGPHCSGGDCTQPYWVAAQQTGGLDGTLVNNGTLLLDGSPGFEVSIIGVFTGTVQGCGTGSFALSFPLTKGSATTPFSGAEVIVPGSGTGELAGISGAGTYTFDPLGGSNGTSTGSMTVLCKAS